MCAYVCVVIMGHFQEEANLGPLHAQQQEQSVLLPRLCFLGQLGQDLWLCLHGLPGLGRTPEAGGPPSPPWEVREGKQASEARVPHFLCANFRFPAFLSARDSGL